MVEEAGAIFHREAEALVEEAVADLGALEEEVSAVAEPVEAGRKYPNVQD